MENSIKINLDIIEDITWPSIIAEPIVKIEFSNGRIASGSIEEIITNGREISIGNSNHDGIITEIGEGSSAQRNEAPRGAQIIAETGSIC